MISLRSRFVSFALLLATYSASYAQTPAANRITEAIDASRLLRLSGSAHPVEE